MDGYLNISQYLPQTTQEGSGISGIIGSASMLYKCTCCLPPMLQS